MRFDFTQNYKTINEIRTMMDNEELIIDNSYQRKSVWGEKDQVRLIETILINLVVPSLFFWKSDTDPETGKSTTHIVDGQQRIKAIIEFVNNRLKLSKKHLIENEVIETYGNLLFNELDSRVKSEFWNYKLNIVEIDTQAKKDDIKKMFNRLNMTDYNLSNQEKRNTIDGEFSSLVRQISELDFWSNHDLFKVREVQRSLDIEFCASLILLSKRGIIDQSNQKVLYQAYEDYQINYNEADHDRNNVLQAIEIVESFINEDTIQFVQRTTQLYTIFSIAFFMIREAKAINQNIIDKFSIFVGLYNKFKNEENITLELDIEEQRLYDLIKKYKQASSEGIRKQVNRMARYDVLKKFLFVDASSTNIIYRLIEKLEKVD